MKKTKKIKAQGVLKVVDILATDVNLCTWNYCNNFHAIYIDRLCGENLINIGAAIDEINEIKPKMKTAILKDLKQLISLSNKNDAAYIRFIKY